MAARAQCANQHRTALPEMLVAGQEVRTGMNGRSGEVGDQVVRLPLRPDAQRPFQDRLAFQDLQEPDHRSVRGRECVATGFEMPDSEPDDRRSLHQGLDLGERQQDIQSCRPDDADYIAGLDLEGEAKKTARPVATPAPSPTKTP